MTDVKDKKKVGESPINYGRGLCKRKETHSDRQTFNRLSKQDNERMEKMRINLHSEQAKAGASRRVRKKAKKKTKSKQKKNN